MSARSGGLEPCRCELQDGTHRRRACGNCHWWEQLYDEWGQCECIEPTDDNGLAQIASSDPEAFLGTSCAFCCLCHETESEYSDRMERYAKEQAND